MHPADLADLLGAALGLCCLHLVFSFSIEKGRDVREPPR